MSDNDNDNFNDLNDGDIKASENLEIHPHKNNEGNPILLILSIVFSVLGFIFICIKLLLDSKSYSHSSAYNMGYIIGGLIFLIIIFIVFRKRKTPLLIFTIIYLIFSSSTLTTSLGSFSLNSVKVKAAQQKFAVMCSEVYQKRTTTDETYDRAKYGDMAEFLTYMNGYFKKTLKLSSDMNKDVAAVGFGSVLKPETLKSIEKMNNAKKSLSDSSKMFDKYEASYSELSSSITSDIDKMHMSPVLKQGFISSFTKAQIENNNRMSSFFNVEREISDKLNEILDFMITREGSYDVENGQVVFENSSDVDKYNAYMKDLTELANKEKKITTEAQNASKAALEKLNQYK